MTAVATPDAARLVFAAVAGLILLLILIIKFKVHAMISILIGAVGIGPKEAERPRRSRKGGNARNAGGGSPRRNTAARQYGGAEKVAPWPSAESGKGCD